MPDKTGKNKSKLTYLKRKLLETDDQKETRLAKRRKAYQTDDQKETRLANRRKAYEIDDQKQTRLANRRKAYEKIKSLETDEERQQRLAKQKVTINQKSQENAHGTMRIAGISNKQLKTKSKVTQNVTKQNLAGSEKKTQESLESLNLAESEKKTQESRESLTGHCVNKQTDSLIPITENKHMFNNIDCFHNSNEYKIKQCTVCLEAWPVKSSSHSQKDSEYQCVRCSRDKKHPQIFSKKNYMVPSAVPSQLQGLTQIEEMLIARALPIMRVYIKPGGQRGYSGHCINLPQHVQELATSLPRYPKDLALIVIKMKGKDNTFKDVTVRRRMVQNALTWLINNNPHYQDVHLNQQCLASLPENSIPNDLIQLKGKMILVNLLT